jgi:hypothetical protein
MNTYNLRSRNTEEIKDKLFKNQYAQLEAIVQEWTDHINLGYQSARYSLPELRRTFAIVNEKYQSMYDEILNDMDFTDNEGFKSCTVSLVKGIPILQEMYYSMINI